jgi:hypothetical protein
VKSLVFRGWALVGAAALCIALPGVVATLGASAHAGVTLEERKLPMRFSWIACQVNCKGGGSGWVSAVGIVTADSPQDFDEFARGRQLNGATIVLDSSGGSVNDSIALGRRWHNLGALTAVGISAVTQTPQGARASIAPEAYCESMCVFLLLSGKVRYVPEAAHVRVHQIWMGDRADDAKAASYSAQDMMPPWEDLHELSREELRLTNLVTTEAVAEVLPQIDGPNTPVAELATKPVQDRFASETVRADKPQPAQSASSSKSTKTAEATVPGGVVAVAAPAQ